MISRRAAGEKVFGVFAFKQKALKPAMDAIRVLSHPPADAAEWAHVRDYVSWRKRFLDAQLRWQGLAPELGAASVGLGTLRQLSELSAALNDVMIGAPRIYGDVRARCERLRSAKRPTCGRTTSGSGRCARACGTRRRPCAWPPHARR